MLSDSSIKKVDTLGELIREVIYRLISEIRADIINNPQTKVQNPAAIFTKRIKEIAQQRGIKL
jgi:hypothetical protein